METEHFRPPVVQTCEVSEYNATDQYLVEVGNQEVTVVELEVCRSNRQENARHPPDDKAWDKGKCPHHWRCHANSSSIHRKQPVKYLNPCWDCNQHRGYCEECIHVRSGTHREEVMRPCEEGQEADDQHREYH
ncbi:hypothetical protein D3C75_966210 [compost metagenome]